MRTQTATSILQRRTDVEPPSELRRHKARVHVEPLTKPSGSRGHVEELASQMIAIRQGQEPAHRLSLDHLNLTPVPALNMGNGERSRAVLAIPILDSAFALYTRMGTFTSAEVSEAS